MFVLPLITPAAGLNDVLRHVKDGNRNVESVRDKIDGDKGLENPFEKHPCVHLQSVLSRIFCKKNKDAYSLAKRKT
jgi:hypothetical protein